MLPRLLLYFLCSKEGQPTIEVLLVVPWIVLR